MKRTLLALLALLTIMLTSTIAPAAPLTTSFDASTIGELDQLSMFLRTDTGLFAAGGAYYYDDIYGATSIPGWSTTIDNASRHISLAGPDATGGNFNFFLTFTDSEPLSFDLFPFLNNNLLAESAITMIWDGSAWSSADIADPVTAYAAYTESPPTAPVPEPTTMLLFGSGIIGLAAAGRKRN